MLGVGCGIILIPYAYLLSQRSRSMDDVQLLVRTHAPDLTRFPELVSFAVLILLSIGAVTKRLQVRSVSFLFVLSLALTVFAVFNQQVITGQSLQPIHYQVFIGNYVAGLALVSAIGLFLRQRESSQSTNA